MFSRIFNFIKKADKIAMAFGITGVSFLGLTSKSLFSLRTIRPIEEDQNKFLPNIPICPNNFLLSAINIKYRVNLYGEETLGTPVSPYFRESYMQCLKKSSETDDNFENNPIPIVINEDHLDVSVKIKILDEKFKAILVSNAKNESGLTDLRKKNNSCFYKYNVPYDVPKKPYLIDAFEIDIMNIMDKHPRKKDKISCQIKAV